MPGPQTKRSVRFATGAVTALLSMLVVPSQESAEAAAPGVVADTPAEQAPCGRILPGPTAFAPAPERGPSWAPDADQTDGCRDTDLLSPDAQLLGGGVVGFENDTPITSIRTDHAVRFDPFAPGPRFGTEDQSAEEPAYREVFALPFGGDVDGDGKEDILQVEVDYDGGGAPVESVFVGRNGADGHELWREHLGAGVYWGGYLPGDTTGDARPDLAFTTFENVQTHFSWPPPGITCFDCYKWVLTATTRFLSLDGATGEFRWQHEREIVWAFQEQPVSVVLVRNEAYANALGAFAALPDLDGDGGRELLWTPWTSTYAEAYTEVIAAQSAQRAEAIAYSGASGDQMWEVELHGAGGTYGNKNTPALAGAWPGPDGTGDGIPDVYTSEITETPVKTVLTRRGVDGASGDEFWLQRRNWDSDARVLRADYVPLGDGGLVFTLTANDLRSDVEAIDPATGAVLWAQLDRDTLFTLTAGDIGRDGDEDVVYFGYDPDANTVTLEGIRGTTGETISHRVMDVAGLQWLFFPTPLLDHSGDGAVDPIIFGGRRTAEGVDEQVTVTDLTNGTELWGTTGGGDVPTFWLPGSNFDGEGGADVLAVRLHDLYDDPQPRIEMRTLRGPDGVELWQQDPYRTGPAGETVWSVYLGFMRDANGEPGDDFQVSSWNAYNSWAASVIVPQVDLVNGTDGRPYLRLL